MSPCTTRPPCGWLPTAVAGLLLVGCGPSVHDEDEPELVEHRLEPCRQWCEPMLHPECGARPEDLVFDTVDECVEDCADASPRYGWEWARQEDGTDACEAEWIAIAECIDALTCEQQHELFTVQPVLDMDYPCKEDLVARSMCFHSTPSLDRTEDEG